MEIATYRERAEAFMGEIELEYYRHLSGLKKDLAIDPIYGRYSELFSAAAIDQLRAEAAAAAPGDERRRARYLLQFAVEGLLGQATKEEEAELARREATLVLDVDGGVPYRQSAILEANEPDSDRRAVIDSARLEALGQELNPLHQEVLERNHELARELGWDSYRAMMEDLRGIDLEALERQTSAFLAATEARYPQALDPELRAQTGVALADARVSDLPYFFRAAGFDGSFPGDRLIPAFEETMAGMGIDVAAQPNVNVDAEPRPSKSPRAFCTPVRIPEEVYLVVPRVGGRDDYSALFHEGGHTEHYAHMDAALPFEFRFLGDNSVTECFAFLFDHLTENAEWLRRRLGMADPEPLVAYMRANKLVFLRRYAAKLAYELELHSGAAPLAELRSTYSGLLSAAVGMEWPGARYLSDVDPGYYCANYLRAWALETRVRQVLVERHGPAWFEQPAAGAYLRELWSQGQRLDAEELAAEVVGAELDFGVMVGEVLDR